MAFVVLFSTLSFTIESHYCGTNLIDTAIFSKVKNCGMESAVTISTKKSCCKDEVKVVNGQDKLKLNSFDDLNVNQQLLVTCFVYSYPSLFVSLPKQTIPHIEYEPPKLIIDTHVLNNTFLI